MHKHAHTYTHMHLCMPLRQADLAPLGLQLAQWGVDVPAAAAQCSGTGGGAGTVGGLRWLDAPPRPRLSAAAELLQGLGAIDDKV